MLIHLAADHAGYNLKEKIKKALIAEGHQVQDHGALKLDENDDYPDYMTPAAKAVSQDKNSRGIIFGGSGEGEAMVANRIKGVRCAIFYGGPEEIIELSRQHNDANMLAIGARFVEDSDALYIVSRWLKIRFSEAPRHIRRINKF